MEEYEIPAATPAAVVVPGLDKPGGLWRKPRRQVKRYFRKPERLKQGLRRRRPFPEPTHITQK